MTDGEPDFDPEELAMLRQLFRTEAHEALEGVTARVMSSGSAVPTTEALTEMMRATHTLKGAAGTVGLHAMVDLAHRLEDVFAGFRREPSRWTSKTGDVLVEVIDALREYLDVMEEPNADVAAEELRMTIDQIVRMPRGAEVAMDSPVALGGRPATVSRERRATPSPPSVTTNEAALPEVASPRARRTTPAVPLPRARRATPGASTPGEPQEADPAMAEVTARAAVASSANGPASAIDQAPASAALAPSAIGPASAIGQAPASAALAPSANGAASAMAEVPASAALAPGANGAASAMAEVPASAAVAPGANGPASAIDHAPASAAVPPSANGAASAMASNAADTDAVASPYPEHEVTAAAPFAAHDDAVTGDAAHLQDAPTTRIARPTPAPPLHRPTRPTGGDEAELDEARDAADHRRREPLDEADEAVPQAVRDAETQPVPWAIAVGARAARDAREARSAIEAGLLVEPRSWLRIEPERVDEVVSSAGELLFDRTRIERRVQLLRTLARDLARTRQVLHDAIADDGAAPAPLRNAVIEAEGELAGQAALLSQTTAALLDEVEALRRTIGELQRGLTRIRMESARSLMLHAARTLRALRRATRARVELRTFGEDTEFDKAVAEQLFDPITQLLRNAVAHGIEPPEERVAHDKPAVATITLRARQEGNSLVLEVSDDGRGIDTAALKQRLVASGRWTEAHAQLADDADVLAALLDTGVSSRGEADELAGRGVGIGLVRQTVARLGGEVKVTSVTGKGTTFTLRLPVTAALAQAMLFKVDGQVYALPGVNVVDTAAVDALAQVVTVRDEVLPVIRLEQLLGRGPANDRRPALVVSFAGKNLVCTVDKVIGPREITVKPLGPLLAPLTVYAGATISGSGKVQLILDPAQLVQRAYPDAPRTLLATGAVPTMLAGRALVVDDSRAIREAMTSMLGSEGWIVDVAEDGGRALRMARQVRYDLVVTDLEMPGLTGFELIARLRDDERMTETPVVVITSRATPEHRRRARDLGVRALVAKPITRRKLLEALAAR